MKCLDARVRRPLPRVTVGEFLVELGHTRETVVPTTPFEFRECMPVNRNADSVPLKRMCIRAEFAGKLA